MSSTDNESIDEDKSSTVKNSQNHKKYRIKQKLTY